MVAAEHADVMRALEASRAELLAIKTRWAGGKGGGLQVVLGSDAYLGHAVEGVAAGGPVSCAPCCSLMPECLSSLLGKGQGCSPGVRYCEGCSPGS